MYAVIIAFFGDEVEVNIFGEVSGGLACRLGQVAIWVAEVGGRATHHEGC